MTSRGWSLAADVLAEIDRTRAPADRVLKRALRGAPDLDNDERATLARSVHGVRCFERRLRFWLESSGVEPTPSSRIAAYRVAIEGEEPSRICAASGRLLAALHGIRDGAILEPTDPLERLAIRGSIPTWFADRLLGERGPVEAEALVDALNRAGPIAVRANALLITKDRLSARLAAEGKRVAPGRLGKDALRLLGRPDIRGSEAWRSGLFEVQDEGSQLVAEAVGAAPGETVIDLCAGAGGKTLALAASMRDQGRLVAADPDRTRLADLRARLARVRLRSVEPVELRPDGSPILPLPPLPRADRVLVDAPCSQLGTLRRGPDRRWQIDEESAGVFPALQLEILRRGAALVRPGGRLVYATCTVLAAENQRVVEQLLAAETDFAPAPVVPEILPDDAPGQLELLPHRHDTDGFFIAAFERRSR
ncbi:MAG: hypothetical protein IT384_28340 [Deltaproteobacteria bacterium]|nr:hypothetical protein [Deltaproteobacteria bacterium]